MEQKIEITVSELQRTISQAVASGVAAALKPSETRLQQRPVSNKYYTRNDIMALLRIPPHRFSDLARKEGFPGRFVGRSWLIPKEEFDVWIMDNQYEF